MEEKILFKDRLMLLGKIYKAGLKELNQALEIRDTVAPDKLLKQINRRDALIKYDEVFYSLISDIVLKQPTYSEMAF